MRPPRRQILAASPGELGIAADRGQRVTQFMRGVRDELPDLGLTRLPGRQGVLDLFEPGELAEGVTARSAPGHRAGHVCIEVGGEHPLVHIADTLHHHAHIEHPEWDGPADDDRALALDTRLAVLAGLRETGTRGVASHLAGEFTVS